MKRLSRVVIGAIIGSFAGIALHYLVYGSLKNDIRSVRWGMNKAQVIRSEAALIVAQEDEDSIVFESEIINYAGKQREVTLSYSFDKEGLLCACFNLNPNKLLEPDVETIGQFYKVREELTKEYGEPDFAPEHSSLQTKELDIDLRTAWENPRKVNLELIKKNEASGLPYRFEVCYERPTESTKD